jgi:hypothetical protein
MNERQARVCDPGAGLARTHQETHAAITAIAGAVDVRAATDRQAAAFAAKWRPCYPVAVGCVTDDLVSLTVDVRFPLVH